MTAILGRVRRALGPGGFGERILSVRYWNSWKKKSNGFVRGLYALDSEPMMAVPSLSQEISRFGKSRRKLVFGEQEGSSFVTGGRIGQYYVQMETLEVREAGWRLLNTIYTYKRSEGGTS
jgi:hypothetical protein